MQRAEKRVDLRPGKPGIPLDVRPLEPLECGIRLPARPVHLRHLVGGVSRVLRGELLQRVVRFGAAARPMMDDRQGKEPRPLLSFLQPLRQRLIAPALFEEGDRQPASRGGSLRRKLQRLSKRSQRLRATVRRKEYRSQKEVGRRAQRILLDRAARDPD